MIRARQPAFLAAVVLTIAGCGARAASQVQSHTASGLPKWSALVHTSRPVDIAGPRRDGSMVLAAAGRLALLRADGTVRSFAPAYRTSAGLEPYIAMPAIRHRGCSFGKGTVYALRLAPPGRGVVAIGAGRVRQFATITARGLIDGITFDETGHFGYRLLVTINHGQAATVDAIGCHGTVHTLTRSAPRMEGGIAVAPPRFGRFAGDLIAPDEKSGQIFAITPGGSARLVVRSRQPHGQDIGVESEGFIPGDRHAVALLADRVSPGNPHPGDDVVLQLSVATLRAAGARPGDLLVAGEGGARTEAVRCGRHGCRVLHVADGPAIAHAEGHIAFMR